MDIHEKDENDTFIIELGTWRVTWHVNHVNTEYDDIIISNKEHVDRCVDIDINEVPVVFINPRGKLLTKN